MSEENILAFGDSLEIVKNRTLFWFMGSFCLGLHSEMRVNWKFLEVPSMFDGVFGRSPGKRFQTSLESTERVRLWARPGRC